LTHWPSQRLAESQVHAPFKQTFPASLQVAPLSTIPSQSLSRPSQSSVPPGLGLHWQTMPRFETASQVHSGAGGQSPAEEQVLEHWSRRQTPPSQPDGSSQLLPKLPCLGLHAPA
jgi:hypothetical protein